MPSQRHINRTPSTIHRAHLSYPAGAHPSCVNVFHDSVDCFTAGLPVSAYCDACTRHMLRNNPTVKLNGVKYVLDYGVGCSKPICTTFGMVPVVEPIYVWRCWEWLTYTAPEHVSQALWECLELIEEVTAAERAAGWDPNP